MLRLEIELLILAPWGRPSIGVDDQPLYNLCLLRPKRLLLGLLHLVQLPAWALKLIQEALHRVGFLVQRIGPCHYVDGQALTRRR